VDRARSGLEKILILLRDRAGHDFSLYKNIAVYRRIDDKTRLYRRVDSQLRAKQGKFPSAFVPMPPAPQPPKASKSAVNLQSLADQTLLQKYSPAAVLVNDKGDILYISGRTGKYLEPAAGKVNWNIFAMAREGLRYELNGVFQKALQQKEAITLTNVLVRTNGEMQGVDITIQAIVEPEALRGSVIIVFRDVATLPQAKVSGKARRSTAGVLVQMERELEQARQEVRSVATRCRSSRKKPDARTRNCSR
jgi:two-component system CheB/CheR fusion protein